MLPTSPSGRPTLVKENLPMVSVIRLPLPFALKEIKIYLIAGKNGYGLLDTGPNTTAARETLEAGLEQLGVPFKAISTIFISHYHSDHVGLAGWVKERSGAKILMDAQDSRELDKFMNGPPAEFIDSHFLGRHGMSPERINIIGQALMSLKDLIVPFAADELVQDGQEIYLGSLALSCFRTPGCTMNRTISCSAAIIC
ncbi:MAG: MBL fold metallo-hydrolase [Deltaproteobacteria bacterium]|nr:MBL fold metallo-hydrolase [Deltaproteobacteria bacterium]